MSIRSLLIAIGAAVILPASALAQDDVATTGPLKFTFVHTSDTHITPYFQMPDSLEGARSWKAVRTLKNLGEIFLRPYATTALAPSFIINTGDVTEFGFPGVTDQVVKRYFGDLGVPVFYVLGNHDGTWTTPLKWMQKKFGGMNYSFNYLGVHFLGVMTAGIQDPRPSIGQETINYVKSDLAKVPVTTPVIVFFHHPLEGSEFASSYDYNRLLDALHQHNILVMLMGHGHSARLVNYDGIPTVMGGSTFSKEDTTDGYNIVSLDGEKLRIAYRKISDASADKPLLERTIPDRSYYPEISTHITQTGAGDARQIVLRADVQRPVYTLRQPRYIIDDELSGTLQLTGNSASVSIPASGLESGVHFVRFTFHTSQPGVSYSKSAPFAVEQGVPGRDPVAAWRFQMGGGSRTKPLHHNGRLYVGGNDGVFYALDAASGKSLFKLDVKSPVTAAPAAFNDLIIFGAGDGVLRAVTESGELRWQFPAADSIMGHPTVHEGNVYFACNGATVYCLDAATGQKRWEFDGARNNVETQPAVHNGKVYFGAWDGDVYCVDANTGKQVWAQAGPRNQTETSLPTYYAPADAAVVVAGEKLFATDRAYHSGAYTLDGKFAGEGPGSAAAFAAADDGKHVYLRRMSGPVSKLDLELKTVWESDIRSGSLPYAPVEADGAVYGVTNTGRLYALDAATGETLWTYLVSPGLYVHVSPTVSNGLVYTVSQDGVVTAVRIPARQSSRVRSPRPNS